MKSTGEGRTVDVKEWWKDEDLGNVRTQMGVRETTNPFFSFCMTSKVSWSLVGSLGP